MTVRTDLKLYGQAIRNGWQIPDAVMEYLPKRLLKIMSEGSNRDTIAAAKVLAMIVEKEREANEPKQIEHHHRHTIEPVTAENLDDHKQRLLAELDRVG